MPMKGATKEDLDNMRGVLQSQVDEKMPWLSSAQLSHVFGPGTNECVRSQLETLWHQLRCVMRGAAHVSCRRGGAKKHGLHMELSQVEILKIA